RTNRFECILDFMTKNGDVHILSSWVEEFEFNPGDKGIIKKVPSRNSILKYSKNRSPFNHPAVAFKKCEIMRVGGYGNEYLYEDYALWLKSLANGCNGDNIQQVLVDMRFSKETAKRRGGIKYAISEIKAQYHFYRANYISYQDFIINIITRIFVRLLPTSFRGYIYKKVIRRFL
ncbi:TPA: UDP-Gal:alpha-D-GlcNAc-diphosphoundecaprenol beta-1,3-galactosyltransferase, partial [Escherichia coli]|nr:UDP-Gal:alpha-D-GlcNAc-diphosphoundecaprenol beta-1,3-galactosyltransferase [Escherichia coli]